MWCFGSMRMFLDRRDEFQVVAEAGTVAEATEMARRFQP